MKVAVFASVCALLLAGCQTGGPKQTGGTVLGAVAGGVLGAQVGGGTGRVVAASVGTLGGAMLGSSIGRDLDDKDRLERQYDARYGPYRDRDYYERRAYHERLHREGIPHRHR